MKNPTRSARKSARAALRALGRKRFHDRGYGQWTPFEAITSPTAQWRRRGSAIQIRGSLVSSPVLPDATTALPLPTTNPLYVVAGYRGGKTPPADFVRMEARGTLGEYPKPLSAGQIWTSLDPRVQKEVFIRAIVTDDDGLGTQWAWIEDLVSGRMAKLPVQQFCGSGKGYGFVRTQ